MFWWVIIAEKIAKTFDMACATYARALELSRAFESI